MATVLESEVQTMADMLERLGNIPPQRIRFRPAPGQATVDDVLAIRQSEGRLCELVDGVLVEKAMSFKASFLAAELIRFLGNFVTTMKAGIVVGEAGMMRISTGLVRIPDVSFVSWARLPGRRVPDEPVPFLAPNIAVEVLSPGNTTAEMSRKRDEFFNATVQLVWIVDPDDRTIAVYKSSDEFILLTEVDTLDGGSVLPGFRLELRQLFGGMEGPQE